MSSIILSAYSAINSFMYNMIDNFKMAKLFCRIHARGKLLWINAVAGRLFCYSSD
jgi:hypothetical protein